MPRIGANGTGHLLSVDGLSQRFDTARIIRQVRHIATIGLGPCPEVGPRFESAPLHHWLCVRQLCRTARRGKLSAENHKTGFWALEMRGYDDQREGNRIEWSAFRNLTSTPFSSAIFSAMSILQ